MTVLCFERHPVSESGREAFERLIADQLELVRSAPGILWADLARASDDDPSYLVLSEWRTEADADAWESGELAVRFTEQTDPLLRSEPTKRRFVSFG